MNKCRDCKYLSISLGFNYECDYDTIINSDINPENCPYFKGRTWKDTFDYLLPLIILILFFSGLIELFI